MTNLERLKLFLASSGFPAISVELVLKVNVGSVIKRSRYSTCYTMDNFENIPKLDTEGHIVYKFIYTKSPEKQIYRDRK